tara:strand:- start:5778 stop:6167 length:390 start_codon:yes stop_codon:yes gene_type:complete
MILGIGTDIIDITRIKNTIQKYGDKFKQRCFSEHEIKRSESKINSVESYAKRYAAKEACAKALGTGLARGVFWKDIEIKNNKFGKPYILLHNKAFTYMLKFKCKNSKIEVSLSDEKKYAIANVIIYCQQ